MSSEEVEKFVLGMEEAVNVEESSMRLRLLMDSVVLELKKVYDSATPEGVRNASAEEFLCLVAGMWKQTKQTDRQLLQMLIAIHEGGYAAGIKRLGSIL